MSTQTWDIALTPVGDHPAMHAAIPAAIGRELQAAGLYRAKLEITPDGILIKPYLAPRKGGKGRNVVTLPDWGQK